MTMIEDQPKSGDPSPLEAFKRQLPDPDPQETSEWIEASSMRTLAANRRLAAKSGPITTPRFGEGGGPETRSCANQALATSVSSCHANMRKPAGSIASRVALIVRRKLVAGVRAQGSG